MTTKDSMTVAEKRAAFALAAIFFLRMLGLFMLLPVLALYADKLRGASPLLIGVAIGIYGLSQAALQIPLGRLSDRIGRKPVIAGGLAVFSIGGVLAALSGHIAFIIAGRALQGAGAISGALLALAADLTRVQQRTKVMAIIGVSIGISFSAAFVLGPLIDAWLGLSGLFWCAATFGVAAQLILWRALPEPSAAKDDDTNIVESSAGGEGLAQVYVGVFTLHGILAASFVSIPLALLNTVGIAADRHFTIYCPVLLVSLVCVAPMILRSHRGGLNRRFFQWAIVALMLGEFALWRGVSEPLTAGLALVLFFVGFNFLEASLPSLVSKLAPQRGRGGALGTYATLQFLGTFIGGLSGGAIAGEFGFTAVFAVNVGAALAWWCFTVFSHNTIGSKFDNTTDTDTRLG